MMKDINEIKIFCNKLLLQLEEDKKDIVEAKIKLAALFAIIEFAHNNDFDQVSEALDKQTKREKSIFKKSKIKNTPFGEYIKKNILDKSGGDMIKVRKGLLLLSRFLQAYGSEK